MKIKAWNFNIVWEDGTEEKNVDLPNHIMNDIEDFLNYLEEVENDDEHCIEHDPDIQDGTRNTEYGEELYNLIEYAVKNAIDYQGD